MNIATPAKAAVPTDWPNAIYRTLKHHGVAQISYEPDAGHSRLIELSHADPAIKTTVLTTEEEGVALSAGAWLGGRPLGSADAVQRRRQLRQHAVAAGKLPLPVPDTGDHARRMGRIQPVADPMGKATAQAFEIMGVTVFRLEQPEDAEEVVSAACSLAFESDQTIAILISQRMLGRKKWTETK
jgi:sulfopyruvate decarboxylase TPP-binding subunit